MKDSHTPIFAHVYKLAKQLYDTRPHVPKQDRHGIWLRCETTALDVLECVMTAERLPKTEKARILETASRKLDTVRVLVRLAKDCRAINLRRYAVLQESVDTVGRMLGGWMKSLQRPND